ncbi:hypothetical protein [Paenibacillus sp. GCM10027626]|uniref:hypothetical protein n=1 Tax=Paenibacillus sp. GCM10027626 TaxID=3273411 RepID=UPI003627D6A3
MLAVVVEWHGTIPLASSACFADNVIITEKIYSFSYFYCAGSVLYKLAPTLNSNRLSEAEGASCLP